MKLKLLIFSTLLTAIIVVGYILLFGKMFPYSPVIIGFTKEELAHSVIHVEKTVKYNDLESIDSLIPFVEDFHQLRFKRKAEIFIFKDSSSYRQRSFSRARFCTFYNGRIFIAPWALKEAQKGVISLEIYLKHELSHSIMHQHLGIIKYLRFPKWLLEGIAVYSSDQMGTFFYPSKNDTYHFIRQGNFIPPHYFRTKKENQVQLNVEHRISFMYSEFGCIVEFLIEKYGKGLFLSYMNRLLKDCRHDDVFKEVYRIDFKDFIAEFKRMVMQT